MDVKEITSCCGPVLAAPLAEADAEELAAALKVVADPVRLRILSLVAEAGEICSCDLVTLLDRSQPTISHHTSVLTDAGLLHREKRGKWAWFSVVPDRLRVLRDALGGRPVRA
jgi:ArsR family transcriptional regulator